MGVSGDIFSGTPSIVTIMYKITFVVCLSAVAALTLPLEDNAKFKVANAVFANVYKAVAAGDHINLRPVNNDVQAPQIANAYLADSMDVANAKEAFMDTFRKVEAGGLKAMQAPAPKVAEHVQQMSAPVAVYSAHPYQHMANNNFANKHVTSKALNAKFKAANKAFTNVYKSVAAGDHINLRPVNNDVQAPQIANAYLADSIDVAEAKEAFMDTFRNVEAAPKVAESVAPVAVYNAHPHHHMANSNFANKHVAPSSYAVASKAVNPADPKNTAKFKAANKAFTNEYKLVAAGDHINQRPVNTDVQAPQIANAYLADSMDVAKAKEAFMDTFRNVKAVQAANPNVAKPVQQMSAHGAPVAVYSAHSNHHMANSNNNFVAPTSYAVTSKNAIPVIPKDTAEVNAAKKAFATIFKKVEAGDHINLRPVNSDVQAPKIANAYLADSMDVAEAREAFMDTFRNVKAMQTPKDAVSPIPKVTVPATYAHVPAAYAVPHTYAYGHGHPTYVHGIPFVMPTVHAAVKTEAVKMA